MVVVMVITTTMMMRLKRGRVGHDIIIMINDFISITRPPRAYHMKVVVPALGG
jgi:hypothetical protein